MRSDNYTRLRCMLAARLRKPTVAGDLKQAFLQIRLRKSDRDALRFHWLKDKDKDNIGTDLKEYFWIKPSSLPAWRNNRASFEQ